MDKPLHLDRRTTLKWVLSVAGAAGVPASLRSAASAFADSPASTARGYGTDPDLLKTYHPGELWPLTLSADLRRAAGVLCDVIIPADDRSASASSVGVVDFIDEWISAPYAKHAHDRDMIVAGLRGLDQDAQSEFHKPFVDLAPAQLRSLCDRICYLPKASAERQTAAAFFARFRDLTAGAYYTTPEGSRDLGFVGNVALSRFDGPPPEVLKKVGLA